MKKDWIVKIAVIFIAMASNGSSGWVRGGPRNMKSMRPPLAAIFFMTYFHRARGGHGPLSTPWIRYWWPKSILSFSDFLNQGKGKNYWKDQEIMFERAKWEPYCGCQNFPSPTKQLVPSLRISSWVVSRGFLLGRWLTQWVWVCVRVMFVS